MKHSYRIRRGLLLLAISRSEWFDFTVRQNIRFGIILSHRLFLFAVKVLNCYSFVSKYLVFGSSTQFFQPVYLNLKQENEKHFCFLHFHLDTVRVLRDS